MIILQLHIKQEIELDIHRKMITLHCFKNHESLIDEIVNVFISNFIYLCSSYYLLIFVILSLLYEKKKKRKIINSLLNSIF